MKSVDRNQPTNPSDPGTGRGGLVLGVGSAAVLALLLWVVGRYGADQDLANLRILHQLDAPFARALELAGALRVYAFRYANDWISVLSAWSALLIGLGYATAGRQILPTAIGLVALCSGAWGQALIFQNHPTEGWALLGVGLGLAFVTGILAPMRSLPGFAEPKSQGGGRVGAPLLAEATAVAAILVLAVIARTYALTELRSAFDGESVHEMNMSRTVFGMRHYLSYAFIANASGLLQLPPQSLAFELFGTSIFSQRYSATIVGSFVLLLSYLFMRRIAGVWPALLTLALLVLAPEQLFWSRSEVTQFAAVLFVAIVLISLSFAMARELSFGLTLATMLAMPMCRLVYTPGWALVALPWAMAAHAVVLRRVRWSRLLYVVPLLALGTFLWAYSPSLLRWTFLDSEAHFVEPTRVYGHSFVRRSGELRDLDTKSLLLEQVRGVVDSSTLVVRHFFDDCNLTTHWYTRTQLSGQHKTIANAGLTVWAFCGLFYLLARLGDRRAFGLVVVSGLAVAPTVMSPDPYPRRMEVIFLVLPFTAAIFGAALVRSSRAAGAKWVSRLLAASMAVAAVAIAITSAHSYFQIRIAPHRMLEAHRFTRPLFASSDVVFHNLPYRANGNFAQEIALGSLDQLVENGVGFEPVEGDDWLSIALHPRAAYSNPVHDVIMSEARRRQLSESNPLERITFLFDDQPRSQPGIGAIRALFPQSEISRGAGLVAVTAKRSSIASNLVPVVEPSAAHRARAAGAKLNGRKLKVRATDAPVTTIEAGVAIGTPGWFGWQLKPPCDEAVWQIGDAEVDDTTTAKPMLTGIHSLRIEIPDRCALPLQVQLLAPEGVVRQAELVAPALAERPALRPTKVAAYPGFREVRPFSKLTHQVIDIALDGDELLAVGWHDRRAVVTRIGADGNPIATWDAGPDFPAAIGAGSDGTVAILSHHKIRLFDRGGQLRAEERAPGVESNSTVHFTDQAILITSRQDGTLNLHHRNGKMLQRISRLRGTRERFVNLRSLALGPDSMMVLTDESNRAFVTTVEDGDYTTPPSHVFAIEQGHRGTAIDHRRRILIPSRSGYQVFTPSGTRLIAEVPESDLTAANLGGFPIAITAGDRFYSLDRDRRLISLVTW